MCTLTLILLPNRNLTLKPHTWNLIRPDIMCTRGSGGWAQPEDIIGGVAVVVSREHDLSPKNEHFNYSDRSRSLQMKMFSR